MVEGELREAAAIEAALYSVVADHMALTTRLIALESKTFSCFTLAVVLLTIKDKLFQDKAIAGNTHLRYKKKSNWVISDEILRENVWKHLVEGIIPIYRAYVKNYCLSIQNDAKVNKYMKYMTQSLENKTRSLFQPKQRKGSSIKHAHLIITKRTFDGEKESANKNLRWRRTEHEEQPSMENNSCD
ncbi:hypothetical protein JHK86_033589 [Glycine max]|nr:hypothetical protein JHK86_033589 [Glycine max]